MVIGFTLTPWIGFGRPTLVRKEPLENTQNGARRTRSGILDSKVFLAEKEAHRPDLGKGIPPETENTTQHSCEGGDSIVEVIDTCPESFKTCREWIAFTDLHVRRSTIQTCLQVLRYVHEQALRREAGVVFLGDFWHSRGDLPVEPLNLILEEFSRWTQPMIMISGNHDQVSIDGELNALEPIALAAGEDRVMVFSKPTLFLDALWLPFRRNDAELLKALGSTHSANAKAIFCHIDVYGADMNNGHVSVLGTKPNRLFHPDTVVYSGHFHKPQTVPGTGIRYLGSPYQISLSEAGQSKALVVLDSQWTVKQEIPIDFGPRHFRLKSMDHLEKTIDSLRANDLLALELPSTGRDSVESIVRKVVSKGAKLQLKRKPKPTSKARIENAESLSLERVFTMYAEIKGCSKEIVSSGLGIIRDYLNDDSDVIPAESRRSSTLELVTVNFQGFGSFEKLATYSAKNRGVVLVVGENSSSTGLSSNAAGKTTMMVAPLWCLTGFTDIRPDGTRATGLSTEMLNDNSESGFVQVEGLLDGRQLRVTRSLRRKGRRIESSLEVILDGKDLTKQTRDDTQAVLESLLGASLLSRTFYFGQNLATRSALELTDKALKDEISRIVPLERWRELRAICNKMKKDARLEFERKLAVLHHVQAAIPSQKTLLEDARTSFEEEQARYDEASARISVSRGEIAAERSTILNLLEEAEDHGRRVEELKSSVSDIEEKLREHEQQVARAKDTLEAAKNELRGVQDLVKAESLAHAFPVIFI
uniref:Calcineurin-like phosphoesterase domain-containing protein n=2 Tax=Rhodosorus marinus TaxID=101924 RepID=A0A7S3E9L9_9RHOD|mmetsp:Transcript_1921/g.7348  ORF Transcript_1921/g.7348 Transcript_1921/m.7348 type:complete len:762 (+) Transcript_1921:365-2650(+)